MAEMEMFAEFSRLKDKVLGKLELIHSLNKTGVVEKCDVKQEFISLLDQMRETITVAGILAEFMQVNIKSEMEIVQEEDSITEYTNHADVEEAEKTAEASSKYEHKSDLSVQDKGQSTVCMKEVMDIEENIADMELPQISLEKKVEGHNKENMTNEYTNKEKVNQKPELKRLDEDVTKIGVLLEQREKDYESIVPMIQCILENQRTLLKNQSIMNQKLDHCTYNGVRAVPDEMFIVREENIKLREQLLQKSEDQLHIGKEIQEIKMMIQQLQSSVESGAHIGADVEFGNLRGDLQGINKKLGDKHFKHKWVSRKSLELTGCNQAEALRRLMRAIFRDDTQVERYNWAAKGNTTKRPFSMFKNIIEAIKDVLQNLFSTPPLTVENLIKMWLKRTGNAAKEKSKLNGTPLSPD